MKNAYVPTYTKFFIVFGLCYVQCAASFLERYIHPKILVILVTHFLRMVALESVKHPKKYVTPIHVNVTASYLINTCVPSGKTRQYYVSKA